MKEYYTQMEAAKKGIITPEMEIVAKKEYMDPEKLRALVASPEHCVTSPPRSLPAHDERRPNPTPHRSRPP